MHQGAARSVQDQPLKVSLVINTAIGLAWTLGVWVAWSIAVQRGIPDAFADLVGRLTIAFTPDGELYFRVVLMFAIMGLFRSSRDSVLVFTVLLMTNAFSVAATWSVEGRFLVPQLFILHALCAVGIWSCIHRTRASLDRTGRLNA